MPATPGPPPAAPGATPARPLAIKGLRVLRDGVPLLESITLALAPGEMVGVIGAHGAGTTSLLQAILGTLPLAGGRIWIGGRAGDDARSRLAYLPQRFAPPDALCGHDFIALSLACYRRAAPRAESAAMAQALGLDPAALARPIRGYGKGQRQRLGLLAVLLSRRPLLLLDQPFSGLAPDARRQIRAVLAGHGRDGHAVLLASPFAGDHAGLDRIAVLHQRRLAFLGPPQVLQQAHRAPTLESAIRALRQAR